MASPRTKATQLKVVKKSIVRGAEKDIRILIPMPVKLTIAATKASSDVEIAKEDAKINEVEKTSSKLVGMVPNLRTEFAKAEKVALLAEIEFHKAQAAMYKAQAELNDVLKNCYLADGEIESLKNQRRGISENSEGVQHGLRLACIISEKMDLDCVDNFRFDQNEIIVDYNPPPRK
jgi:hypothetical protein